MKRIEKLIVELAKDMHKVPQILVVEDDPNDMDLMAYTLDKLGCEVYKAKTAEEALEFINSRTINNPGHPVDIVLLDLKLVGGADGTEVLRVMSVDAPNVPVIVVTGCPEANLIHDACQIGYFGLVQKPLQRESVCQIFNKHKIVHGNMR